MKEHDFKYIGESTLTGKPEKPTYPITHTKAVFDDEHVSQDEINNRLWERLGSILVSKGVIAIGDDGYWYVDGEKTNVKAEGIPGKDAEAPLLRVSADGQSLEMSVDGGDTWYTLLKDFNKLRVIGYVDSQAQLPKNALVGDIYGVWNPDVYSGNVDAQGNLLKGAYDLYINTVRDWVKDYDITKVYGYDTELPASATDGTAVLVPVSDLTLDKEKVDGYKVYKFSLAQNGWSFVLNTAEIYAGKDDILNYGDNVYALVQGDTENTYVLYRRETGWVYFGTNASITYKLVQNISEGTENNILSGKAVKDVVDVQNQAIKDIDDEVKGQKEDIEAFKTETNTKIGNFEKETTESIEAFRQEVKDTYGEYIENPEFIRVTTDAKDRVLYGVQKDGNFYFGAGCPQQVKDYIQTELDKIIGVDDATEKIDTLNEIIAFFDQISHDTTLKELLAASAAAVEAEKERAEAAEKALGESIEAHKAEMEEALDTKVDKEPGKSLIDEEYAESISWEDNPEFIDVELDAQKRILEAHRKDGTKLFGGDVEMQGATFSTVDNPEFLGIFTEGQNRILMGFQRDGNVLFGCGVPQQIVDFVNKKIAELLGDEDTTIIIDSIKEIVSFLTGFNNTQNLLQYLNETYGEYVDNPEYLRVDTDAEGRIFEGNKKNGMKYLPAGVDLGAAEITVEDNPEFLNVETDGAGRIMNALRRNGTAIVGGVDINELKEAVDNNVIGIEYEPSTGKIYAYRGMSSNVRLTMDEDGKIYKETTVG